MASIIDDPLDPPGFGRIGGGHLFVFDLGRYLIRRGHSVTYLTRLNDAEKPLLQILGERCRILRIPVGPRRDVDPGQLAPYLDDIGSEACKLLPELGEFATIHSHYWVGGYVARRLIACRRAHHVHSILSLGRVKAMIEPSATVEATRDRLEVEVFNAVDRLVCACPNEASDLARLYPEVRSNHVHVIPYGVDPDVFFSRPEHTDRLVRRAARRLAEGPSDLP